MNMQKISTAYNSHKAGIADFAEQHVRKIVLHDVL